VIVTSCTVTPEVQEAPVALGEKAAQEFRLNWAAALDTALGYPLEDQSRKDGYIESAWIYKTKESRYRFFIHVKRTGINPYRIYVQSQKKLSPSELWRWQAPSVDIKENIRRDINVKIKKHKRS